MKRNIKLARTAKASVAVLLAASMAACGAAPAASGTAPAASAASAASEAAQTTVESVLDPANPVTVTIWTYYNGDQQAGFENMVQQFNQTVGLEKGVAVEAVSQSDINQLADELLNAVDGKAGAQDVPDLAAVYPETMYALYQRDALTSLDGYFTQAELDEYVPGFVEEGRLYEGSPLYGFPVSKSTEVSMYNKTDWQAFEDATGVTIEDTATAEGMTAAAEKYYEWTDSLTPDVPEDGKALYGRDSLANYLYIGACQLGQELFIAHEDGTVTVNLDRDTFKTLWDNYYIPYINGYFASYGKFRSDDAKTGQILALTGSTASAGYFPTTVYLEDDTSHDIEVFSQPAVCFANRTRDAIVQQGAGYCVLKSEEARQQGAVEFLKWFTDVDQNVAFAAQAGYSPVKLAAEDPEKLTAACQANGTDLKSQMMMDVLVICADQYATREGYSCKPFDGCREARSALESRFGGTCTADREAVLAKIAGGMSREEAVAEYSTDEYFDAWFTDLCTEIDGLVAAK